MFSIYDNRGKDENLMTVTMTLMAMIEKMTLMAPVEKTAAAAAVRV